VRSSGVTNRTHTWVAPALLVWAGILLFFHATSGWVPILDHANLAFHEAGHPIFGIISNRLSVYGGTFMQLLIPAACAFEMKRQGKRAGAYVCLVWFAESLLNVARYMADARARVLPLVGGADPEYSHDWTNILGPLGLLEWNIVLANSVRVVAVTLMVWTIWRAWKTSREEA